MKINRLQVALVSVALLTTAILAEVLAPRELMARTASIDLEAAVPKEFGVWKLLPDVKPITPDVPASYLRQAAGVTILADRAAWPGPIPSPGAA